MAIFTYSEVRKNFKKISDKVYDDKEAVIIARKNNKNAVLLSEEEYNSLMETTHLVKSPANVKRLLESVEQLENNRHKKEHYRTSSKPIIFTDHAWEDYLYWKKKIKKGETYLRAD